MMTIDALRNMDRYRVKYEVLGDVGVLVISTPLNENIVDVLMDARNKDLFQLRAMDVERRVKVFSATLRMAFLPQANPPSYEMVEAAVKAMDDIVLRHVMFNKMFVWENE